MNNITKRCTSFTERRGYPLGWRIFVTIIKISHPQNADTSLFKIKRVQNKKNLFLSNSIAIFHEKKV
jgi:hypothetical protein